MVPSPYTVPRSWIARLRVATIGLVLIMILLSSAAASSIHIQADDHEPNVIFGDDGLMARFEPAHGGLCIPLSAQVRNLILDCRAATLPEPGSPTIPGVLHRVTFGPGGLETATPLKWIGTGDPTKDGFFIECKEIIDFDIKGGPGDDLIILGTHLSNAESISVNGGGGNDDIIVEDIRLPMGPLIVLDGADGDDKIAFSAISQSKVTVDGGLGLDDVTLHGTPNDDIIVAGTGPVAGPDGKIYEVTGETTKKNPAPGEDINLGSFLVRQVESGSIHAEMGDDDIVITNPALVDVLNIFGDDGNDTLNSAPITEPFRQVQDGIGTSATMRMDGKEGADRFQLRLGNLPSTTEINDSGASGTDVLILDAQGMEVSQDAGVLTAQGRTITVSGLESVEITNRAADLLYLPMVQK